MNAIAFALAYLTCLSNGRRLQSLDIDRKEELHRHQASLHAFAGEDESQLVQARRSKPSAALAMLLLSSNPAVGYQAAVIRHGYGSRSGLPVLAAKDPNAPKKPLTGYFRYLADQRPALAEQGLKVGEIAKKVGAEWKALPAKQKKPYLDAAAKDKVAYEKALAKYQASPDYVEPETTVKATKDKSLTKMLPNKPKQPKNGYMLFAAEKRAEVKAAQPDATQAQIMKTLGAMWSEAPDDIKKPFEKQYAKAKTEYQKKMKTYKQSEEYLAYEAAKR